MANAIYWDTSALLKLYAPEADSSDYRQLLISQPEDVAISVLHHVELYFALRGKESRDEIAVGSAKNLFESFEAHVRAGRYRVIPWREDVAFEARQLLDHCMSAAPPLMLRSLDGLHLGALRAAKITGIVTSDLRMRHVAAAASIAAIEP